jgi:hypothetical protein
VWALFREDTLESEHEAVLDLPGGGRLSAARFDLDEGIVERAPSGGPGREDLGRVFAFPEERLTSPGFCSEGGGR